MSRAREIIESALNEGRNFLLEPEAKTLCSLYGIPVTRFKVAKTLEEAKRYAAELGYPVVLKVVSPDVLHKSDVGGVVTNIKTPEELEQAYNRIIENVRKHVPNARIRGVLVQEYVPPATEVIVGVAKDPQFGHVVMFGLGGIFVEVLKDVTFRVLPVSERDAYEMIREIKGYPILKGYRGSPPADIDAIVDIIMKVSKMVAEIPEIEQLDLNPILVYERGAKVIDARVIFQARTS